MKRREIEKIIEAKYNRYTRAIITEIKSIGPEARLSGDDSDLENVWEEFKYQVRHGESIFFEVYEEDFKRFCLRLAERLPQDEVSLLWLRNDKLEGVYLEDVAQALYDNLWQWADQEPILSESTIEDIEAFDSPDLTHLHNHSTMPYSVVIKIVQDKYERYINTIITISKESPAVYSDGSVSDNSIWKELTYEQRDITGHDAEFSDIILGDIEDVILKVIINLLRELPKDEIELMWRQSQHFFEINNDEPISYDTMLKGVQKELYNRILVKGLDAL